MLKCGTEPYAFRGRSQVTAYRSQPQAYKKQAANVDLRLGQANSLGSCGMDHGLVMLFGYSESRNMHDVFIYRILTGNVGYFGVNNRAAWRPLACEDMMGAEKGDLLQMSRVVNPYLTVFVI